MLASTSLLLSTVIMTSIFSLSYFSKKAVRDVQATNKLCILDVEIKGVKNLKKTDLNPRYIFIKPPSMKALVRKDNTHGSSMTVHLYILLGILGVESYVNYLINYSAF